MGVILAAVPASEPSRRPDQLPPGRHKLTREFVAQSQRGRILDGMIEAAAELGYEETRLADVIERAGVSRKTFYEYFADKEECFLAAYEEQAAAITQTTADAFAAAAAGRWPDQVRDAITAFLAYLREHQDAARVCIVEVMGAGRAARERRDLALRSFTFFIDSGRPQATTDVPGRTAAAILGAANELIASELLHGNPDRIETLAPDLVYLICLPFLGPKKALAEREKTTAAKPRGRAAKASKAPAARKSTSGARRKAPARKRNR